MNLPLHTKRTNEPRGNERAGRQALAGPHSHHLIVRQGTLVALTEHNDD
jgi:hypothetical protein